MRVTFYLKGDAVQAFSVRFDIKDLERVAARLRVQYGAPLAQATEAIARPGREDRRVYKRRWEKGAAHAVLSAQLNRKRAALEAWRGDFDTEIYCVR